MMIEVYLIRMNSELSINEFHKRLTQLTSPEKSIFLVTSFKFNGKPFCGTFDGNSFNLTRNSPWYHVKLVSVKGQYHPLNSNKTKVEYQIGRRNWKRRHLLILIILLTVANSLLALLTKVEPSIYYAVNLFIIAAFLYGFILTAFARFIVNQKFKSEFLIDVKPTDLNGYGGEGF